MNDYIHDKVVKWFYDHEELLIAIINKTPYQSDGWDYEIEVVNEFLTTEQRCYCGDIYTLGVIHRDDGPCHYPEHTSEYKRGYADAMNWKVQNHLEHLPTAQPEQEPVAWLVEFENGEQELHFEEQAVGETNTPIYINPPQRTWVGLTIQEANELWESTDSDWELMKRTEVKLKEKNK